MTTVAMKISAEIEAAKARQAAAGPTTGRGAKPSGGGNLPQAFGSRRLPGGWNADPAIIADCLATGVWPGPGDGRDGDRRYGKHAWVLDMRHMMRRLYIDSLQPEFVSPDPPVVNDQASSSA
jgi:hypothetical protein